MTLDVDDPCPRCRKPLEDDQLNPDIVVCSCGFYDFKIRIRLEKDVGVKA